MLPRFLVLLVALVAPVQLAIAQVPQHVDALGDSVPADALARLGTVRLRHTSLVNGVQFSPDGYLLASAGWDAIRLFEVDTGRLIRVLRGTEHSGSFAIAFSPDGSRLASVGSVGLIRLWDLSSGEEIFKRRRHGNRVYGVAFHPEGEIFATADDEGAVRVWNTHTGDELLTLSTLERVGDVHAIAFSSDGRHIAAGALKNIRIWDLKSPGEPVTTIAEAHGGEIVSLAFLPRSGLLLSSGESAEKSLLLDGERRATTTAEVRLWDSLHARMIRQFQADPVDLAACATTVSADGSMIASVHYNAIHLWETETGRVLQTCADFDHKSQVRVQQAAFSPDGARVAVCSRDHELFVYDAATGKRLLGSSVGHPRWVSSLAVSPDGRYAASGSAGRSVLLWDIAGRKLEKTLDFAGETHGGVLDIEFTRDGSALVAVGYREPGRSGGQSGRVMIWEPDTGREVSQFETSRRATAVAISPDGRRMAVACGLGRTAAAFENERAPPPSVSLRDFPGGNEVAQFIVDQDQIKNLVFSQDGSILSALDERLRLEHWDQIRGEESSIQLEADGRLSSYPSAISDDGSLVATEIVLNDQVVLHDATTGRELRRIVIPNSTGNRVALSHSGRILATACAGLVSTGENSARYDVELHFWDVNTGQELGLYHGDDAGVTVMSFTSDDKLLVTGMQDGTLLLWDVSRFLERQP